MSFAKLGGALVTAAVILVGAHAPSFAASIETNVFLNNVLPNVDFLDRSSRMALTNSKDGRLKAFAHDQALEQTKAGNALDQWVEADKRPDAVAAAAAAAGPDGLVTGRSVAIDGQPAQVVDNRLPMGQEDLDSLEGLNGRDFDSEYKLKQVTALRQLESDYQEYIAKGDDAVLLGLANRELPKVQRRIGELRRL